MWILCQALRTHLPLESQDLSFKQILLLWLGICLWSKDYTILNWLFFLDVLQRWYSNYVFSNQKIEELTLLCFQITECSSPVEFHTLITSSFFLWKEKATLWRSLPSRSSLESIWFLQCCWRWCPSIPLNTSRCWLLTNFSCRKR